MNYVFPDSLYGVWLRILSGTLAEFLKRQPGFEKGASGV